MIATGLYRAIAGICFAAAALATPAMADNDQKHLEEQEMLERARREAPMRPRLEVTVNPAAEPVAAVAPAPVERATSLEDQRRAELDRLSEKLRRAAAVRAARATMSAALPATGPAPAAATGTAAPAAAWSTDVLAADRGPAPFDTTQRSALGRPDLVAPPPTGQNAGRVTILMVMQVGDRGIRRTNKTADPILCSGEGCWVSAGDGVPAQFMSGRRSFGIINTLGARAGACRDQTACVFRAVDLGSGPAVVRPVDLRLIKHDRRESASITADPSCRVASDRLVCTAPVRGPDYVMWVVPEALADLAGPDLLRRAVVSGLATN